MNYEVLDDKEAKKAKVERKGRTRNAWINEQESWWTATGRTNTRDKSGCSKSTRIFSNFRSAIGRAASFHPSPSFLSLSLSSFFRAPLLRSSFHAHVSRFSSGVTNGIPLITNNFFLESPLGDRPLPPLAHTDTHRFRRLVHSREKRTTVRKKSSLYLENSISKQRALKYQPL